MTRIDGRISDTALRSLSCEIGCLQNCDGSCTWKSGGTTILASVHGPIAPRQVHNENNDHGLVSVIIKSGSHVGTYEREWEQFIVQQLISCIRIEQYPRCVISIIVQLLTVDGSVLSAIVHACVMALMDASIEMNYLPIAISCCITKTTTTTTTDVDNNNNNNTKSSRIQLDPSNDEETIADGVLVFVFSNHTKADESIINYNETDLSLLGSPSTSKMGGTSSTMLGCHTSAGMYVSPTQVLNCWSLSSRAVQAIHAFYRLAIEQKVTRESQTLYST